MTSKFTLSLGVQDKPVGMLNYGTIKNQNYRYKKGVLLELDWETDEQKVIYEYQSPKENAPAKGSSIGFKYFSYDSKFLYLCTETEILILNRNDGFTMEKILSLKEFNDVHHVLPVENDLFVASTGLDAVFKLGINGNVVDEWSAIENVGIWDEFEKNRDYRSISTKPHKSHPNYLFINNNEVWVTRFKQKDAVCLNDFTKKINIEVGNPHDGIYSNNHLYFTTTNGHIVIVNSTTYKTEEVINLNEIRNIDSPLGWTRGLNIQGRYAYVGFTKLRETKLRENLKWIHNGFDKLVNMSTRIEKYDLYEKCFIESKEIKIDSGSAIFSINKLN
jgi:hypothetical protein